ncbi:ferredoxin family protein [Terrihabitans rhizophilus]|uniref:Ferredoxin family protein n=1 Tax=Terrihabitans rhizophilus TaxID=3092662 RepID=A0ABU4RQ38_9HYPH|nr:ferredoxin family protein [Terrihabitans sp. PJ23]MDX6806960.1 ferredoxin family protein [Terrihabitans sp. PJ23]
MIEVVSESRCTACNLCVKVCPANVFDVVTGGIPVIARQRDCQTCFLCEIYCPADALFVAPKADTASVVDEYEIEASGLFGSYARALGWENGRPGGTADDPTHRLRLASLTGQLPSNQVQELAR